LTNRQGDNNTMTPEQISLVQGTWSKVVPISETAASMFYDRLFELDPSLRSLFKKDMTEQKKMVMSMIGTAVNGLSRLERIVPAVQDLGRRHAKYGVKIQHYETVGNALLWTLGQGLGEAFTPPVKDAWVEAYTTLASTMKDAAAQA
jgi:hemoglobin-like flavoprotein